MRSRIKNAIFNCSLIVLLGLGSTSAQQQYYQHWTTEDGLPQTNVINVAQTPDGYLWVATVDGLARFDGVRFRVFNKSNTPEMPNNRIFNIFTDTAGRLWFNYQNDETVVVYENGRFKSFQKGRDFQKDETADPLVRYSNEYQRCFLRRPEMRFRKGDTDFVYDGERFVARPAADQQFPSRVFGTDAKSVWIDEPDALIHIEGEKLTRYPKDQPLPITPEQSFPLDSAERDGVLWFISSIYAPNRLLSFKDGRIKTFSVGNDFLQDLEFDARGNLWIAVTYEGLIRVDAATVSRNDPANFPFWQDPTVSGWKLFRDRDNNMWFGGPAGLRMVNPEPAVTFLTKQSQPPIENVYPIVQDTEGTIWFGAWTDDRLFSYRSGNFASEHALVLTALFVDSRARLWKGTGLNIEYRDHEKWAPVSVRASLPAPLDQWDVGAELAFITEDRTGTMWFGNFLGLIRYDARGSRVYTVADGLPSNTITSYLFTRAGEMWIGTTGGVARMENDRFHAFTETEGLAGNYTRCFYEDADGTIWIGGYDGGLTRYKNGVFKKITQNNGLFSNGVFVILEDESGWFWMNSNQGIYRVRRQELNDFADGKVESVTSVSYGPEDGLTEVEGNGGKQPAGLKAADGRLWFPMAKGVAIIDPKTIKRASTPPPVLIEEARIDQKVSAISPAGIRIEPNQNSLEIDYTALGFVGAERMRFRYRLEGLDEVWTEAGGRRTAYFSHLPYGEYTLRVIAANYDGVWNTQGATIKIVIVRPFYRKTWFYALLVIGVFGTIALAFSYRVRQLRKQNEARAGFSRRLIESQESERRRIALELHDSIGQSLAVIRNRTLMGLDATEPERMRDQFREISHASNLAIKEARSIAHNLHPAQIENLGLSTALASLVNSIADSTGMNCEADIGEVPEDLPYDVAINFYRIAQECLSNIIKHSDASLARVTLRNVDGKLVMTIEDDGRGFTPQPGPGLGLTGMRERAAIIGADLVVASQPGEGTTMRLSRDNSG